MATTRTCDRCNAPILPGNDMLQDTIDREYQGNDICPNCDITIKMAQGIITQATIQGRSPKEILKEMLGVYGL